MEDIRQSFLYAQFMRSLGWEVEKVGRSNVYIRRFPLIGSFIKIQKVSSPISFAEIEKIRKKYNAFKVQIAPDVVSSDATLEKEFLKHGYRVDHSPNIPTTTIHIDLKASENIIFSRFSEAKRRAVRRAIKNGVIIKQSNDIQAFMGIRIKNLFPMGFFVRKEMQSLWNSFYPKQATLLLAYIKNSLPISGILLLHYENNSYYWYASSLSDGKKTFAPTLLVWEALKICKKRGDNFFDFEGVYDDRFPKATNSWKGFTKFKEGFGGQIVEYVPNFCR